VKRTTEKSFSRGKYLRVEIDWRKNVQYGIDDVHHCQRALKKA
jgi:hypothetical protein